MTDMSIMNVMITVTTGMIIHIHPVSISIVIMVDTGIVTGMDIITIGTATTTTTVGAMTVTGNTTILAMATICINDMSIDDRNSHYHLEA
ncbi:MAG: hypothetical protein CDV28_14110 [Candidatus Electronema aureum]|uniref:Uncharacterized protein n=1 Tax=Candidatus Electronema aureum TaxID=2005002 RepID=A0A521FZK7_9BACT|nr:MAG: hypothetical protein CDV28_14110 [Candidatus Electronema aureum]